MTATRVTCCLLGAAAVAGVIVYMSAPKERNLAPLANRPPAVQAPVGDLSGVCVLSPTSNAPVRGTIVFRPRGLEVEVSGTIEGLPPGRYHFNVAEYGDLRSPGRWSFGDAFYSDEPAPGETPPTDASSSTLMSFEADEAGVARISQVNPWLSLYGPDTILGRSFVLRDASAPVSPYEPTKCIAAGVIGRANPNWTSGSQSPLTAHDPTADGSC